MKLRPGNELQFYRILGSIYEPSLNLHFLCRPGVFYFIGSNHLKEVNDLNSVGNRLIDLSTHFDQSQKHILLRKSSRNASPHAMSKGKYQMRVNGGLAGRVFQPAIRKKVQRTMEILW